MTNLKETQAAATQDLDEASLDLVVGGAIMHDVTGDTSELRKQEQADKWVSGRP